MLYIMFNGRFPIDAVLLSASINFFKQMFNPLYWLSVLEILKLWSMEPLQVQR